MFRQLLQLGMMVVFMKFQIMIVVLIYKDYEMHYFPSIKRCMTEQMLQNMQQMNFTRQTHLKQRKGDYREV